MMSSGAWLPLQLEEQERIVGTAGGKVGLILR